MERERVGTPCLFVRLFHRSRTRAEISSWLREEKLAGSESYSEISGNLLAKKTREAVAILAAEERSGSSGAFFARSPQIAISTLRTVSRAHEIFFFSQGGRGNLKRQTESTRRGRSTAGGHPRTNRARNQHRREAKPHHTNPRRQQPWRETARPLSSRPRSTSC